MLHCLGPDVQRIFDTLPGEHKTLGEVKTALSGHCTKTKRSGRTLQVQIASSKDRRVDRHVSDQHLRAGNQIVEKCSSGILKHKLLQQDDLELAKTITIVRSAETVVQEARILSQETKENPIQIDHVHSSRGFPAKQFSCYMCGGTNGHSPDECGAIKATCNPCKRVGHLPKVCRSKPKATHPKNLHKQRPAKKEKKAPTMKVRSLRSKSTNWLEDSSSDQSEPVLSLNNVDSSITVQKRCLAFTRDAVPDLLRR